MKKVIFIITAFILSSALLTGCSGTDVVLKYSPGAFEKIVDKYPELITDNTLTDHYYYFTVDGETTLKVSHDYEMTGLDDILIETPIKPFIDAGLNISKLVSGYKVFDDMLCLTADYGDSTGMKDTVTDSLFSSVIADRSNLTYHQELDHYGIKLTAGKFEWAKDFLTNDKDVVFIIKAQPLKEMGADVEEIMGWAFVTMQDSDGSDIDILLKSFNLDSK